MKRTLSVMLLFAALPAVAQEGPSFDCAKAASSAEDAVCADADLARLDRRVADRFAAALDAARGLGAGAVDELRAMQRGWIKGRDDCWKADDLHTCVERAYLLREGELVARWMLEPPTGTAIWTCGDTRPNEVVTMFFDTGLPSVRFERGDTVATGSLSRTASGSRYDGDFGRYIWMKGDEATYRDPDPDGTTYSCVLTGQR